MMENRCETLVLTLHTQQTTDTNEHGGKHEDTLFSSTALSELSADAQRSLVDRLLTRWFLPGEALLTEGQLGSGLYILKDGRAQVQFSGCEQRQATEVCHPGDILGEMSLLTGSMCTANVVAVDHVRTLLLTREDFEVLKAEFPEIEIALCHLVSDRLGHRSTDALCGKRFGGYLLRRCISRGGMGVVYEASDRAGQSVALKMLRHRFVHEQVTINRFVQEGQLLSELKHSNIVSVRDCFVAFNTRFLVMDYWDGTDLACVIHERGRLPEPVCRSLLGQVAQALAYAHAAGVLHLDIKPANILVARDGRVALTDFGLCKLLGATEDVNTVVGTLPYMPPEQFQAGQVRAASDWYALACTAAELLTGKRLFTAKSFVDAREEKAARTPCNNWPRLAASDAFKQMLVGALHPDWARRQLDLQQMAAWSQSVPGLC
ncbi:MAG: protein kinase [Pirellulaceae bacterium]